MKYNNEFKVIDSPEKAYILGQMYGDGYNGCKTGGYKFSMASINTDTDLYLKINSLFPFLKVKHYPSHSNMIYLECHEKEFCLDLKNLGMLSNKTEKDKTGDFHFPKLKEEYISHFIRGYFDADGSFWCPSRKRSRNNLHTSFGCSTKNFLLKIKKILDSKNIKTTYNERYKKASNGNYYISYCLEISNRENSLKFASYIYKNATLFLPYKKEKTEKSKDLITAFDIYGNCPLCGSNNIRKNGIRDNKQRLRCNDCKKSFTKSMPT